MITKILSKLLFGIILAAFVFYLANGVGRYIDPISTSPWYEEPVTGMIERVTGNPSVFEDEMIHALSALRLSAFVLIIYGWLNLRIRLRYWLAIPLTLFSGYIFTHYRMDLLGVLSDPQNHIHELVVLIGLMIIAGVAVTTIERVYLFITEADDQMQTKPNLQNSKLTFSMILFGGILGGILTITTFIINHSIDMILSFAPVKLRILGEQYAIIFVFPFLTSIGSTTLLLAIYGWSKFKYRKGVLTAFVISLTQWALGSGWYLANVGFRWDTEMTAFNSKVVILSVITHILLAVLMVWVIKRLENKEIIETLEEEDQRSIFSEV